MADLSCKSRRVLAKTSFKCQVCEVTLDINQGKKRWISFRGAHIPESGRGIYRMKTIVVSEERNYKSFLIKVNSGKKVGKTRQFKSEFHSKFHLQKIVFFSCSTTRIFFCKFKRGNTSSFSSALKLYFFCEGGLTKINYVFGWCLQVQEKKREMLWQNMQMKWSE